MIDISVPETQASTEPMPVLFIGHGNPLYAIQDNEFTRAWVDVSRTLPKPQVILCISAHWETDGSLVTAMAHPRTIHDFYGFPQFLYDIQYPAPGAVEQARLVRQLVPRIGADEDWGLDHGAWSVLIRLFPKADIPVFQLSLDRSLKPREHYQLAREIRPLRDRGVLILGSGNIVHNLRLARLDADDTIGYAYDWAESFDLKVRDLILEGADDALIDYHQLGRAAELAVPTAEHYLPLLYVLGARDKNEPIRFFAEKMDAGSLSMRSLAIG